MDERHGRIEHDTIANYCVMCGARLHDGRCPHEPHENAVWVRDGLPVTNRVLRWAAQIQRSQQPVTNTTQIPSQED